MPANSVQCSVSLLVERDGGDELYISHGREGTWRLIGITLVPHTTLAAHASNEQTITFNKGAAGTALGYLSSDSDDTYGAAFTKSEARHVVLTGTGKSLEFTKSDVLEIDIDEGGTAAALDCSITVTFEQII